MERRGTLVVRDVKSDIDELEKHGFNPRARVGRESFVFVFFHVGNVDA